MVYEIILMLSLILLYFLTIFKLYTTQNVCKQLEAQGERMSV
jgi:hypothetical protein